MQRNNYNEKFEAFVKEKAKTMYEEDLKNLLEKEFKMQISKRAFKSFLYRRRIKCIDFHDEKIREQHNHKAKIGEERMGKHGILLVKIAEPDIWQSKNRLLYEQYHNCKLTNADYILFLNKNKNDYTKENLIKVSRKEALMVSGKTHMISKDREITKTGILLVKLRNRVKQISNNN